MLRASPLESQVVLGTDASKHCQLLATQTRRAALSAGNQPNIFGTDLVPPRTQEITQRVGFRSHRSILRLSSPLPPSIGTGKRDSSKPLSAAAGPAGALHNEHVGNHRCCRSEQFAIRHAANRERRYRPRYRFLNSPIDVQSPRQPIHPAVCPSIRPVIERDRHRHRRPATDRTVDLQPALLGLRCAQPSLPASTLANRAIGRKTNRAGARSPRLTPRRWQLAGSAVVRLTGPLGGCQRR